MGIIVLKRMNNDEEIFVFSVIDFISFFAISQTSHINKSDDLQIFPKIEDDKVKCLQQLDSLVKMIPGK